MEIIILVSILLFFVIVLGSIWWFNQKIKKLTERRVSIPINPDEKKEQLDTIHANEVPEEPYIRWTWDEYFIELVQVVGGRSTCDRGRSGAVITKNNRILSTGYVGSPAGLEHCDDIGHEFKKTVHGDGKISNHCVRTAHAEQNAIVQAARYGIVIDGSTLYCNMVPCYICAKLIINAGIKRVVARKDYHAADDTKRVFEEASIDFEILDKSVEEYGKQ